MIGLHISNRNVRDFILRNILTVADFRNDSRPISCLDFDFDNLTNIKKGLDLGPYKVGEEYKMLLADTLTALSIICPK